MRDGVSLNDRFEYVEAFVKSDSTSQPEELILKHFTGYLPMMSRILAAHLVNIRVNEDQNGKNDALNERFYANMQDAATMFLKGIEPLFRGKIVARSESEPVRNERAEMLPRSVSAPARPENKVPQLNIAAIEAATVASAPASGRSSVSSNDGAEKPKRTEMLADIVAKNDQRPMNISVGKKLPSQPTFNDIFIRCNKIIASMNLLNKNFNKSNRVNIFTGPRTKQNIYSLLLANYILAHTQNVNQHYAFVLLEAVGKVLNTKLSELFPHNCAQLSLSPEEVKNAYAKGQKPVIRLIPQYIDSGDNFSYLECTSELEQLSKMKGYSFSPKNPPIRAFAINEQSNFVFVVLRNGEVECIEFEDTQVSMRALPDVVYELLPAGANSPDFESVIGRQLNGL